MYCCATFFYKRNDDSDPAIGAFLKLKNEKDHFIIERNSFLFLFRVFLLATSFTHTTSFQNSSLFKMMLSNLFVIELDQTHFLINPEYLGVIQKEVKDMQESATFKPDVKK